MSFIRELHNEINSYGTGFIITTINYSSFFLGLFAWLEFLNFFKWIHLADYWDFPGHNFLIFFLGILIVAGMLNVLVISYLLSKFILKKILKTR